MPRPLNPLMLTAVLSGASLLAYVGLRVVTDDGDPAPVIAAGQTEPRPLADRLPDIVLEDLDGAERPLSTWADQPLLVNFWATWCAPCLREIPMLKAYQQSHPELTVLGVAIDRPDPVAEFARDMEFNYPVLVDWANGMNAAAAFGVDVFALPISVFVDANGATLGVHTGELHDEHLANFTAVLADRDAGSVSIAAARRRMAGRR